MAKTSKVVKNEQRRKLVERYAERRAELKETLRNPTTTRDQRTAAVSALQRLPRDSSPVRLRNRDAVDGRPRKTVGFMATAAMMPGQAAGPANSRK